MNTSSGEFEVSTQTGQLHKSNSKCFEGVARRTWCATRSKSAPRSLVSARFASPMQSHPIRRDRLATARRSRWTMDHGLWTMDYGRNTADHGPVDTRLNPNKFKG